MSDLLIQTVGLGKSYPKAHRASDRFRALARLLRGSVDSDALSVLRDVSIDVRRGESVGVIGENGAGKSTLLKLITRVLTPTTGTVRVNGTVGALLELGAGFHPEYSGRDNIAMSAALHGLTGAQLEQRLPEIIEFADIGSYIDEPVKHYSSGMVVRLGFAVVASMKPDLLITDEVLAVGDESFQKKCVRWMEAYLADGGTLLLVSHSMYHVQKLCRRALWLRHGEVAAYGDVFDVSQAYLAWHERKQNAQKSVASSKAGHEFEIEGMQVNGVAGEQPTILQMGDKLHLRILLRSREERVPVVLIGITRADGSPVYGVSTEMDQVPPIAIGGGRFVADIEFPDLALLPGSYNLASHVLDPEGVRMFDTQERGLTVRGESREFGLVRLPHRWIGTREIGDE